MRVKLDEARQSLAAIDEERKEIAFTAHTSGGESEKTLAKLNKDRLLLHCDIESLEAAHIEASRRVADAERAEELAADAEKAASAVSIAGEIEAIGKALDKHLAGLGAGLDRLKDAFDRLHACGPTHPSHQQRQSFGERAVHTALMKVGHRVDGVRFLPPRERYEFSKLTQGWGEMIRRWAEQKAPQREAAE